MPSFNQTSKDRLATCDARLQQVFNEVIKYFDCTVLCGHRNQADQDAAFASGKSQKKWPNGNHNWSWYDFDNTFLDDWATALFYIAPSKGADAELERASKHRLKIFRDLSEVPDLRAG